MDSNILDISSSIKTILDDLVSRADADSVGSDILPLVESVCKFDSNYGANDQSVSFEGVILEYVERRTPYVGVLETLLEYSDKFKLDNMVSNLAKVAKQPNITGVGILRIIHDTVYFLGRKYNSKLRADEMHSSLSAYDVAIPSSRLLSYVLGERLLGDAGKLDSGLLDRIQEGDYLDKDQMLSNIVTWANSVSRSNLQYTKTAINFLSSAHSLITTYEKIYEKSKKAWRVDSDVVLTEPSVFKNKVMSKSSAGSNEIRYEPFAIITDIATDDIKSMYTDCKFVTSTEVDKVITRMSISNNEELSIYCFLYLVTVYTGIAVELTRVIKEMFKNNNILASVSLKQAYSTLNKQISFPLPTHLQPKDLPSVKWTGVVPNYAMQEYLRLFSDAKVVDIEGTAKDMLAVLAQIRIREGWGKFGN